MKEVIVALYQVAFITFASFVDDIKAIRKDTEKPTMVSTTSITYVHRTACSSSIFPDL
ncbi:hypothetical protein ACSVDA_19235 [Cytobacillus sp. Hm23]